MKKIIFITCFIILCLYKLPANVIYVMPGATGTQNGTSWVNAYTQLYDAVTAGVFNDTIWVAAGTYYPTLLSDRYARFNLHCSIYGGFAGNETLLNQRNWKLNPTIISGDIGIPGNSSDNTLVLILAASGSNASIDGFTITDAHNELSSLDGGAAILVAGTFASIRNCIIKNNYGLKGCCISMPGIGTSLVHAKNTIFLNNTSPYAKGIIDILSGTNRLVVTGCVFNHNSSDGGTCLTTLDPGDIKFYNNTFVNNITTSSTGASIFEQSPNTNSNNLVVLNNNIYWNNTGGNLFAGISTSANFHMNYSIINSATTVPFQAINTIFADPLFADYDGADNISGNDDDYFALALPSPAINAGYADTTGYNLLPYDLDGTNRVVHDTVDIGAYEYGFSTAITTFQLQGEWIKIFPNPAGENLLLQTNIKTGLPIEYTLTDIAGHVVKQGILNRQDLNQQFYLNIQNLRNGQYSLSLGNINNKRSTKLIIQH